MRMLGITKGGSARWSCAGKKEDRRTLLMNVFPWKETLVAKEGSGPAFGPRFSMRVS